MVKVTSILITVLMVVMVGGCSSSRSVVIPHSDRVVLLRDAPTIYGTDGAAITGKIGTFAAHRGDTVSASALHLMVWRGERLARFFLIDTVGAHGALLSEDDASGLMVGEILRFPTSFSVPTADAPAAWGRAADFILRNSALKIQTSSDNAIQTYSPTWLVCDGCIAAAVSRIPGKDSTSFSVRAWSNTADGQLFADEYARRLAFFMATGRE